MIKPVCVQCQRFFRPEKNGITLLEGKPYDKWTEPGKKHADEWSPYKIWQADLWRCHGCDTEIIVGSGMQPISADYQHDFNDRLKTVTHTVNDC